MRIREVYLNGVLMREGEDNDYVLGKLSLYFNFKIKAFDKITTMSRGWLRSKRRDFVTGFPGSVKARTPLLADGLVLMPVYSEVSESSLKLVG